MKGKASETLVTSVIFDVILDRIVGVERYYSKQSKREAYEYVSAIMGTYYNPFLSAEAGGAFKSFEITETLTFCTEKLMEADVLER